MLVLTRKHQERIRIGDDVVLTVLRIKGNTVRLGIEAPRDIRVVRGELAPKEVAEAPQLVGITIDAGSDFEFESVAEEAPAEEQPVDADSLRQIVRRRRRQHAAVAV